ncbi:hypothetical protein ADK75_03925 [Streptomyces virginiae]|uniref:Lsr2-like protein n=1 Tax=Streptomyces virginiae TaxID=1961 RepID=A0A0L8N498_STRVG|nr:Lsr2 family protein [Streptomyces virginiae]KOG57501.1 hypothetical protein ADK75_03925 [Streptomyces virginiae]
MVQRVVTLFIDDLTGEESREVATHTITLDGVLYEIDLAPDGYDQLYAALEPFFKAGRKVGRQKASLRAKKAVSDSDSSAELMRSWAREQGIEVSARGRVPASVKDAYAKAHPSDSA